MSKIAIFASGGGTNAEAIMTFFEKSSVAKVVLLLSNRKAAYALERARNHGVQTHVFSKSTLENSPHEIVQVLRENQIDVIVLAGFMSFVPECITNEWRGRIIKIHPALLPKFGGKGMFGDNVHRAVVEARERESGITIHHVNERYDEGDVIFQARCTVEPEDTPEQVAAKIHLLEQKHFPRVIENFLKELKRD